MLTASSLSVAALPSLAKAATDRALASGALKSIDTELYRLEQGGLVFQVRLLSSLRHRQRAQERLRQAGQTRFNPFLSPEPDLLVCDLSDRHRCLLNKFNVVSEHLLIVTREFEDQQAALGIEDFQVLLDVLQAVPGLGFYNSGPEAGASQSHRHLQLVPRASLGDLPIDRWLAAGVPLPFEHRLLRQAAGSLCQRAVRLMRFYRQALQHYGLESAGSERLGPYNLLVTQQWALLVPRCRESFGGISINALGFAGALLVRDRDQLACLREQGAAIALTAVSGRRD